MNRPLLPIPRLRQFDRFTLQTHLDPVYRVLLGQARPGVHADDELREMLRKPLGDRSVKTTVLVVRLLPERSRTRLLSSLRGRTLRAGLDWTFSLSSPIRSRGRRKLCSG